MKKKISALLIIISVLSGIFFISIKNNKAPESKKIILYENQIEPYLNINGFDVQKINVKNIRIPLIFNDKFQSFSDEMKNRGFELENHTGEEVRCYTYKIENSEENAVIQLLISHENELISAAVIEQKQNGSIRAI